MPQQRHLRRPPAHHRAAPRRRGARLEPVRDHGVAHGPHERHGAALKRLGQRRRHGGAQHGLAPEAHVYNRTFRERVQPRAEIGELDGCLPAAGNRGVRLRSHGAHCPGALEAQVLERLLQVPPLQRSERVEHEPPAVVQVPHEVLPHRRADLLVQSACHVVPVHHQELSPLVRRLAGNRRERDAELVVAIALRGAPHQAAEGRVRDGGAEDAGRREHDPSGAYLAGQRLSPSAEEVGDHGDDGIGLRFNPREDGPTQLGQGVDEGGELHRAATLGILEPRGQGWVGGEREGSGADGGGVCGEERGEKLKVCRGRDHGEAEAARRQEGDEVDERQRVALRGEGDDKHVRPRLGGWGRLHGWGLCGLWRSGRGMGWG
uniref:Uncharacterized protein n=1 Tax=Zea mays TaxID=4577 RepID=A0A804M9B6_MAIZE